VNVFLGARADTVNVRSTLAGTTTNIFTGTNGSTSISNVVNVSNTAAITDGSVDSIAGNLVIFGQSASDTVNVYDKDDAGSSTAFVNSTRVWGLGMPGSTSASGGISYSGLEALNLLLGTRVDTVNVLSTASGNVTTVFTGSLAANVVNVGSTAPGTNGDLNGIAGQLVVNGQSGNDTLNAYDKDENGAETGFLTATRIWGFDMPASLITMLQRFF
jgi:hypothetical protein